MQAEAPAASTPAASARPARSARCGADPHPPTGHASRSSLPPRRPGYRPHTSRQRFAWTRGWRPPQAWPGSGGMHSFFQEQIKGPENAPIARFDGLGCYRIGSENALVFSVRAAAGACWRRIGSGFGAALGRLWGGWRAQGRALAVLPPCGVWGPAPGPVCKLAGAPVLLQKQEQIKGPENAPIARFDGLGCYRIGSEMERWFSACGQRQKRVGRPVWQQAWPLEALRRA